MKQNALLNFIRPFLYSIFAVCIAGTTMAILNVLVEIIRGNSAFGFADIFHISLWHIIIWVIFGSIVGAIYTVILALRKKEIVKSSSYFIYAFIFIACWLLFIGYINIYFLPLIFSIQSVMWNLILFFIGFILLIIILKTKKIAKLKSFSNILKVYIFILIIMLLVSFVYDMSFLPKAKKFNNVKINENTNYSNVIIILLDAVRYDHLGCYGYGRETSSNIDRLAANGVIFENAFAQSSHTGESVPSLFTSTYPSTHNVRMLTSALPKNILTLPSIFKLHGYKTAIFSTNPNVSTTFGYNIGVDDFIGPRLDLIKSTILSHLLTSFSLKVPVLGEVSNYIFRFTYSLFPSKNSLNSTDASLVTQKIISWLSENQDEPFFLYIHYTGGHSPYIPPKPYDRLFDPDYPNKPVANYPESLGIFLPFSEGKSMPQRELENLIAQYDGEIFYHDINLRFLFNHLTKLGLDNKTIMVLTSDHGEEFFDHNGWGHGHSLFDEVIHIPLIFYGPGLIPEGKRIQELVELVDIFPTLCSLCGISDDLKLPYKIEGIDLASIILSKPHKHNRKYIFSEVNYGGHSAKCLRTKDFKAVLAKFGKKTERMLFSLISDPFERDDIYDKEKQIGTELFQKLELIVKRAEEKSFDSQRIIMDESLKEKLRTLGYIK